MKSVRAVPSKRIRKFSAFTLVELIVVITILAILATVGFLTLSGYTDDARSATVAANVRTVYSAILTESTTSGNSPRYYVDHDPAAALSGGIAFVDGGAVALTGGQWGSGGTNYSAGNPRWDRLRMNGDKFRLSAVLRGGLAGASGISGNGAGLGVLSGLAYDAGAAYDTGAISVGAFEYVGKAGLSGRARTVMYFQVAGISPGTKKASVTGNYAAAWTGAVLGLVKDPGVSSLTGAITDGANTNLPQAPSVPTAGSDYSTQLWNKISGTSSVAGSWYGYRPNTLGTIIGVINGTWLVEGGGGSGWDGVQWIKLIKTDSSVVRQYSTSDGGNNLWALWLPVRNTLIWAANGSPTIYYKNNFTSWVSANSWANGTLTADGSWTLCTQSGFGNVDGNQFALNCGINVTIYDGPNVIDSWWTPPSETNSWRQTFYVNGGVAVFAGSDNSTCSASNRFKVSKSGTQLATVSTTYPISLIYGDSGNDVYFSSYNGWGARCSSSWGWSLISSGGTGNDDFSVGR